MGAKLRDYRSGDWAFHCPGCGCDHIFLSDCWHALADKTVDLPDWDEP